MRLTSDDPVSAECAAIVKEAATNCLPSQFNVAQLEDARRRVVDLVTAVLERHQRVPRMQLYRATRELWETVRHMPGLDQRMTFRFRSIVTDCLRNIRGLTERSEIQDGLSQRQPSQIPVLQPFIRAPLPLAPLTGSPVPWLSSIHSPIDRGGYGDPKYPGNCSGLLIEDLLRYFRPRRVLDPLTGGGTCRDVCKALRVPCESSDLKTGFDACDPKSFENLGRFDFVWIHPPYWRQKIYSDDPRDLSNTCSLDAFLERLRLLIRNCANVLTERGLLAILMGNYSEKHTFIPLTYFTMQLCLEEGLWPACTDIVRFQHNASRSRERYESSFIPNLHEVCLILERRRNPDVQTMSH